MAQESPYLSVVAVSRNDEHGGNTLERTQIFVDSFLDQCERHQLSAELIIVEWNPPGEKAALAEVISWAKANQWVDCRVVTVPTELHRLLDYSRVLPLFQMIGKNVGIRRARGEFVLATNIDIMLSEEVFGLLASRKLRKDRMYRCDRFDVDSAIKNGSLDEKLNFAWENIVRRNVRTTPAALAEMQQAEAPTEEYLAAAEKTEFFDRESEAGVEMLVAKDDVPLAVIHLSACGDFTLLHRDGWADIGGYAEWAFFSLHLDSVGVHTAHRAGYRETWLVPPAVCFHVEHALGSGYTEGQAAPLYERLSKQGIGWFDYEDVRPLLARMEEEKEGLRFNHDFWGMRDIPLLETECCEDGLTVCEVDGDGLGNPDAPAVAIREEFETTGIFRNRIALIQEAAAKEYAYVKGLLAASVEGSRQYQEAMETKVRDMRAKDTSFRQQNRKSLAELRSRLKTCEAVGQESNARVVDLAEKTRAAREKLAKYQRKFGWLERFGLFK